MNHDVTRGARKATRIVVSGSRHLRWMKKNIHRRNRQAARMACHSAKGRDGDDDDVVVRLYGLKLVTGWDVA